LNWLIAPQTLPKVLDDAVHTIGILDQYTYSSVEHQASEEAVAIN